MEPVICLVGRPNVGKSTLFNQLTRSREALVADYPGLTRDRKYGVGEMDQRRFIVVDTGGLGEEDAEMGRRMAQQSRQAIEEADAVLFMVDARAGVTAADAAIAEELRTRARRVYLVVNKTDGLAVEEAVSEFYALGLGKAHAIAAVHRQGIQELMGAVLGDLPPSEEAAPEPGEGQDRIRIAFVGRPNVGKSTLVNRILGEERVVVTGEPGTTRDSVAVDFERDGVAYTLVDTAGVRRRARVKETIEKFSVVKALQAIEAADVVIMVLDAREGISEQDAHLLGLVLEAGRALVLAVNKWDGLRPDQRDRVRADLDRRLAFLDFAEMHFISALHGTGVGHLFGAVERAHDSAGRDVSTHHLTQLLHRAVEASPPPMSRGRRVKLRYAHQGGRRPPLFVIHGSQTEHLPRTYRRYLVNYFREALAISGTPIRLEFKTAANPYAGRGGRSRRGRRRGAGG